MARHAPTQIQTAPYTAEDLEKLRLAVKAINRALEMAERCQRAKMNVQAVLDDCTGIKEQLEGILQEFFGLSCDQVK